MAAKTDAIAMRKHEIKNMEEAVNEFLKELPDPKRSQVSTVEDRFLIGGKEVILTAQKTKGSSGFRWRINIPN